MNKLVILILSVVSLQSFANEKKSAVRGVWVPDPQYTDVLKSYKNVVNFVSLLDSLNFNSIFVVSYALNKTLYPSKILLKNTNYKTIDSTSMLFPFMKSYNIPLKSPSGDPVRDLIDEAHKRNIKVFFWYEFGFMADIKPVSPQNNPILARHPHWQGIGNDGQPASYNKQDFYFNSFDPDVQQYLINLIREGIKKYPDVDGIQGDDRLPAACINSGYDRKTVKLYKKEQGGALPPADFKDSVWVRWRLDKLNDFGVRLYKQVKKQNPNVMVSFSPNPYPWSRDNLLQEWPVWVKSGICDVLAVQCYRRDSISYTNTVKEAIKHINNGGIKKQIFSPGVLLMVSGKISNVTQVKKQILINRMLNTDGEVLFYNEALTKDSVKNMFREVYHDKLNFPTIKQINF